MLSAYGAFELHGGPVPSAFEQDPLVDHADQPRALTHLGNDNCPVRKPLAISGISRHPHVLACHPGLIEHAHASHCAVEPIHIVNAPPRTSS